MRVCHIVPSLEERHGGPSKSVRALAAHLGDGRTWVELLTTAEVMPTDNVLKTSALTQKTFPRISPRWLCRSPGLRDYLNKTAYDCIHHHSLWLRTLAYAHHAARQQRCPLVISPRGMMSPWAYQHRRWRKQLASWLIHPGAFKSATGWHATSTAEADDIRRLGFKQPICVSPNGVHIPSASELDHARDHWHRTCPPTKQRRVALFYSRFHRKKRLRELIDLWLGTDRGDWLLLIVGIAEDYTVESLQAEINARGAGNQVAVFDGWQQPAPYAVASLFLLPSHSENFGLVIAEALAAGVPCLVTDTTPWQELAMHEAGWCCAWDDYPKTLSLALNSSIAELRTAGDNARRWVAEDFAWSRTAALLREFYTTLRA